MQPIINFFSALNAALVSFCETYAQPILVKFFGPINAFLAPIYQPYATIIAIAFFIGTMIWVGAIMREGYVNEGRHIKAWYTDLRLWTVLSMLPHVFVYFYFY